jgi:hypothetical protein
VSRNASSSHMGSQVVTLILTSVHSRLRLSTVLVDKVEGIHRTCSCSTRFNHSASTLRYPELQLHSRVAPIIALGHLSKTLLLFSPLGFSSVESWDTMPTIVLREQCILLRRIIVTGLCIHLHRLILHKILAREANRTMCVAGLIMCLWSKLRMTPAWYWERFSSTLYSLQYCLIQEHHILSQLINL